MHRFRHIALFAAVLLLLGCPRERDHYPADQPRDTVALDIPDPTLPETDLTDRDLLMLIEHLPMGAGYDRVIELFPRVSSPEPATHAQLDQARSEVEVVVLNQVTTLEFNFMGDRLYSYFFHAQPLDCTDARSLHERLTDFYSDAFGPGTEEEQVEPGYTSRTTLWRTDDVEVAVTHGRQADECRVGWGFQDPRMSGGS